MNGSLISDLDIETLLFFVIISLKISNTPIFYYQKK